MIVGWGGDVSLIPAFTTCVEENVGVEHRATTKTIVTARAESQSAQETGVHRRRQRSVNETHKLTPARGPLKKLEVSNARASFTCVQQRHIIEQYYKSMNARRAQRH
eukprot:COSAG01_NODE_1453_length_10258_cov_38.080126_10_plen_107_part_00